MIFIIIYKSWSVNFDSFGKLTIFGSSKVNLRNVFIVKCCLLNFGFKHKVSSREWSNLVHFLNQLNWTNNLSPKKFLILLPKKNYISGWIATKQKIYYNLLHFGINADQAYYKNISYTLGWCWNFRIKESLLTWDGC